MASCLSMEPVTSILVAPADAGLRLDVLVARELGISRGYVRRLLGKERIQMDGRAPAKGAIVRTGDHIQVLAFRHPEAGLPPNPNLQLHVIARSGGLLAIDKPAGLPSHPLDFDEIHTALNGVLALHPEMQGVGEGGLQSGLVHRLDTATSGVLAFATDEQTWQTVRARFAERSVQKRYLARVHGRYDGPDKLSLRLEGRGPRVRVVETGGLPAVTEIRVLSEDPTSSLLQVELITGVRHQIRATLAHLGSPVVGDALYGSDAELERHLLHAQSLRVTLQDGVVFEASAATPAELENPL